MIHVITASAGAMSPRVWFFGSLSLSGCRALERPVRQAKSKQRNPPSMSSRRPIAMAVLNRSLAEPAHSRGPDKSTNQQGDFLVRSAILPYSEAPLLALTPHGAKGKRRATGNLR